MDNPIILELYNGDISSTASSARVLTDTNFFLRHEMCYQHYNMVSDSIFLYETCANQFSVFQEIMQFIPKVC